MVNFFISYSRHNKEATEELKQFIEQNGGKAFVNMTFAETRHTKKQEIRNNIRNHIASELNKADYLIYLHTKDAISSTWTGWELGYMEGKNLHKHQDLSFIKVVDVINPHAVEESEHLITKKIIVEHNQDYLNLYDTFDMQSIKAEITNALTKISSTK